MKRLRVQILLLLLFGLLAAAGLPAQAGDAEFKKRAAQIVQQRLDGEEGSEALQEQALAILDGLVLEALNQPAGFTVESLNERLAGLVGAQPLVGESYRVVRLDAAPPVYALVVNFGLAGPSAVRLYSRGRPGGDSPAEMSYRLAARLDRFAPPDFFDEFLEMVAVAAPELVFVTVTGRTDELRTGAFAAWRFCDGRLEQVWWSDLLPQSSYEPAASGFLLTYCAETEEERPRACRRMTRERYAWEAGAWKRVEQTELPAAPRP